MKKLLLLSMCLLGSAGIVSGQTIWSDNFNDEDISNWTLIDADGDGNDWGDQFTVNNTAGVPMSPVSLISRSWMVAPLTPDNWAISPAIDLSTASGTVTLSWLVQAAAASWNEENYSVYVANSNTTTALAASPVTFNEIYPGDVTGPSLSRTLDISSFIGQTVYVAFRHHNVTDQDWLSIDDVTVSQSLSTADFFRNNFAMYPNPAKDVLNISANTMELSGATITDINGRVVKQQAVSGMTAQINVSELNAGVYFVSVESAEGKGTAKFVKN